MNINFSMHVDALANLFFLNFVIFRAILPPQITLNNQLHASNGNINQVFPAEQWFSEKYQPCEEMTFLKRLLNYSENDSTTYKSLLRHPLVNVFTDLKWKSLEVLYIFFLTMQVYDTTIIHENIAF